MQQQQAWQEKLNAAGASTSPQTTVIAPQTKGRKKESTSEQKGASSSSNNKKREAANNGVQGQQSNRGESAGKQGAHRPGSSSRLQALREVPRKVEADRDSGTEKPPSAQPRRKSIGAPGALSSGRRQSLRETTQPGSRVQSTSVTPADSTLEPPLSFQPGADWLVDTTPGQCGAPPEPSHIGTAQSAAATPGREVSMQPSRTCAPPQSWNHTAARNSRQLILSTAVHETS